MHPIDECVHCNACVFHLHCDHYVSVFLQGAKGISYIDKKALSRQSCDQGELYKGGKFQRCFPNKAVVRFSSQATQASFKHSGLPRYFKSNESCCIRKCRLCFSKSGLAARKNSAENVALGWGRPHPCLGLRPHKRSRHQGTSPALFDDNCSFPVDLG